MVLDAYMYAGDVFARRRVSRGDSSGEQGGGTIGNRIIATAIPLYQGRIIPVEVPVPEAVCRPARSTEPPLVVLSRSRKEG
mmetsp:Transcript_35649/g.107260  ORF Transcript_35649/g.107260 Transcript_35649/m.107260 type:complete len:81 (+) Transcript_35649:1351-1593(+)